MPQFEVMAAPITSPGRFSARGPLGGWPSASGCCCAQGDAYADADREPDVVVQRYGKDDADGHACGEAPGNTRTVHA